MSKHNLPFGLSLIITLVHILVFLFDLLLLGSILVQFRFPWRAFAAILAGFLECMLPCSLVFTLCSRQCLSWDSLICLLLFELNLFQSKLLLKVDNLNTNIFSLFFGFLSDGLVRLFILVFDCFQRCMSQIRVGLTLILVGLVKLDLDLLYFTFGCL